MSTGRNTKVCLEGKSTSSPESLGLHELENRKKKPLLDQINNDSLQLGTDVSQTKPHRSLFIMSRRSTFSFLRSHLRFRSPLSHIVTRRYASSSWPPPAQRPRPDRQSYSNFPEPPRSPIARYLAYLTAIGATTYIYTTIDNAPFTNRTRLLSMSRQTEDQIGKQAYDELLASVGPAVLSPKHPTSVRVRRVVARLAATVRNLQPSLCESFEWSVAVADVEEPNAMCAPGGRILITTSLLTILPTDDHLAVILSHEIAHALNRHAAESMHLQRLLIPLVFIANYVFEMRWLPSLLATFLLRLPYSRKLEHEADSVGLILCAEACYDPRVAPAVFESLDRLQGQSSGGAVAQKLASFFSTHPQTAERASKLRSQIPERLQRYEDKCVHGRIYTQFGQFPQFTDEQWTS